MRTVKYGDVELTVFRATVGSDMQANIIETRLIEILVADPKHKWGVWGRFARLCSQTEQATGLPFDCPPQDMHNAEDASLKANYEAFLKLDKELRVKWQSAIDEEDKPLYKDTDDPNSLSADKK